MAEEGEATRTDVAELVNMPETTRVRSVAYCPVSTLPFEYCEFDADYKASQAWFAENWRSVLPPNEVRAYLGTAEGSGGEEEAAAAEVSSDELAALMAKLGLSGELDDHAKRSQKAGKKTAADAPPPAAAASPGGGGGGEAGGAGGGGEAPGGEGGGGGGKAGKKAKAASRAVVIEVNTRNKRKHITVVKGLEGFEVDLAAAAKAFGKKFACGSALQRGKGGQQDQIEIQGDAADALPAFIASKHKIALSDIFVVVDGKKVPASELGA
ncbi:hypothetical protein EMIHUDRAFT_438426 [Emiliania huxleyi CCMP1516]|uniref:SUI1 domain-containing protein n=2 Tax=Emiliania huxleyi TaxID=2903 RepID=A0A0D3I9H6_EMIH1|nr:hypothetical protein EMIHUDRAFT_438426 [Emiliania huxleyi CCMP1516]EOD07911.1 hypothetical protein EMIHUDRAFT_438426 [Emiliania huxleyi CCMP1516]|eukprot:XP_005760340.1 hypothetical protein EMIHUDRAFT_438426 [Emiliania huxleyi CCMP1516]